MDEVTEASSRDAAADYGKRLDELRRMQRDVRAVTATARTRDGAVAVEVGPRGEVRDIRFKAQAYSRMNPNQLAHTTMKLIGEASQEAAERARRIAADFLPGELGARLLDGEDDVAVFMPDASSMPNVGLE